MRTGGVDPIAAKLARRAASAGGRPAAHRAGARAVAAAQVQHVTAGRRRGSLLEQQTGARVEPAGGEHPGVGGQLQVYVGQDHPDLAGPVRGAGPGGEVVVRHRPYRVARLAGAVGWDRPGPSPRAGLMKRGGGPRPEMKGTMGGGARTSKIT